MSRANFVQVQLAAAATSSQTLLSVKAPVGGFVLPPADGGRLVLTDSPGRPNAYEIITYTSRSGSGPYTLNGVTRGVEGTTPRAWAVDTFVMQSLTVGELQDLLDAKADKTVQIAAGTGLEGGGNLSADRTLSVKFGSTAGTAVEGNDSRLSNSREWTASAVSQAEAEAGTATTARKWSALRVRQAVAAFAAPLTRLIVAGTGLEGGGDLTADRTLSVKYGTTAGTAAEGNDSRLSNSREWTASTVTQAEAEAGTASSRRAWTALRVRQATIAWWNGVTSAWGRALVQDADAAAGRSTLGLGTAATSNVTASGADRSLNRLPKWGDEALIQNCVAAARLGNSTTSGYAVITLPIAGNSSHMISFKVRVYSNYRHEEYDFSGYAYSSLNNWHSPKLLGTCLASRSASDFAMGRDADGKLYVAVPVGQYAGVSIHGITLGYSAGLPSADWSIEFATTKPSENTVSLAFSRVFHSDNFDPDTKANAAIQVIAGTGLTGGGSLSANRTLAVDFGTAAGTVCEGNDSRLSNSREWTAATVTQAEAEAGTATTRRAWTALRVRQAIVAWWNGSADKTKLDGIEAGAQVNTVTSVAGKTGAVSLSKSDVGLGSVANVDTTNASNLASGTVPSARLSGSYSISITGTAATATKLATARTINGVAFDGTEDITITAAADGGTSAACSGNAATATKLATARTINGVSFDGTKNITITAAANGGTADSATTATRLATARTINGVSFDGSKNITITAAANGGTADSATTATKLATARTINGVAFDGSANITISAAANGGTADSATTATKLATARAINGVSFDGTADITLPTVNTSGNQTISGTKTFSGAIVVSATTNSTSATTGSLQTRGGLGVSGNIYAAGNVTAYSDIRLKTDIKRISNPLERIDLLNGVTYVRRDTGEVQTGLIAQDVLRALPEAVSGDEYLGVAYGNMAGLFVEAIKELSGRMAALQAKVDRLEKGATA